MLLLLLSACCGDIIAPTLNTPRSVEVELNEEIRIELDEIVVDTTAAISDLQFRVSTEEEVQYSITDTTLILTPQEDWAGISDVVVEVIDDCDARAQVDFSVQFGSGSASEPTNSCETKFSYTPEGEVTSVLVAGSFNNWEGTPLEEQSDGRFALDLELAEGEYAYKYIVQNQQGGIAQDSWVCDQNSDLFQCDQGQDLIDTCPIGANLCNSVLHVPSCEEPKLTLNTLDIGTSVSMEVSYKGAHSASMIDITLDGSPYDSQDWDGSSPINFNVDNVETGRHRIMLTVTDNQGSVSEPVYVPFWNDSFDWNQSVLYFVFVDRFFNGDTSNDNSYGTNWATGDYMGGDWSGVIEKLDYLQELGVDALWLTAPIDNPSGIFDGQCGMTITGYHGYWPSGNGLEEHFGDEAQFKELISQAHSRGIRVLVDWVGNHLHNDHPYVSQHPEWFTSPHMCDENDNWNNAPETCWFAPYIPTINYYNLTSIQSFIDDAIRLAKKYDIDGYRVDAVKHIPKAVHYNMQTRIKKELEHRVAGGNFEFYTVGETFSGDSSVLSSYVSDEMLDGQFDFALYWSILSAFARNESGLPEVEATFDASKQVYGTALMSNFLGNHDVERFISHAAGEVSSLYGDGLCPSGDWRGPAQNPSYDDAYDKLKLAWTWLLTHEGPALIYYGDEVGLPGYHDPDNRQMMIFENQWTSRQQDVLAHVQKLTALRKSNPEILQGEKNTWWEEPDLLGVARSSNEASSLVIINRGYETRTITNALSWAGLSTEVVYTDLLTQTSFSPNGDELTVTIPARGSVILSSNP